MVDGEEVTEGCATARYVTQYAEITETIVNGERAIDLRNEAGQLCGRLFPDTMELEIKPKGGPRLRVELVRVLGRPVEQAGADGDGRP